MYKNNNLIIGKTYTTEDGLKVTAIANITDDTALFTTDRFPATPFVIWSYEIKADDTISLYHGKYYSTLEAALIDQHPGFQPWTIHVTYYCTECEQYTTDTIYVDAVHDVQSIVEDLEDLRVCPCGTTTNRKIVDIALSQGATYYRLNIDRKH